MGCLLLMQRWLVRLGAYTLLDKLVKIIIILYYVPIVFIILRLYHLGVTVGYTSGSVSTRGDNAFGNVRNLWLVILIVISVLIRVIVRNLMRLFRSRRREMRWLLSGYPASLEMQKKLNETCKLLGIRGRVEMRCCHGIPTAMTCGVFNPKVLLPAEPYGDRELEVICIHELIHIRRRDVLFRTLLDIGDCALWFCPMRKYLFPLLARWSETCTDIESGDYVGGMKEYFDVIAGMLYGAGGKIPHCGVCIATGDGIEERVERMMSFMKGKNKKSVKLMVALLCMVTVLATNIVGFAAGECVAQASNVAYQVLENTETSETTAPVANDGVEYIEEPGVSDRPVIVQNPVASFYSTYKSLGWTVPADHISVTPYFSAYSGGYIKVSLEMDPDDVTIHVGIIEPTGRKRYVIVSGEVYHTFSLTISGTYQVYVENISQTTDINVYGGYFYE